MSYPRKTNEQNAELKTKALLAKHELLRRQAQNSLLAFTLFTMPEYEVNWHHRVLCRVLDRFAKKEIKRLMVFMPPRHGKSELVKRLAAFLLGKDPNNRIISCSHSASLASFLNRDVQRIIDSPAYREIFSKTQLAGAPTLDGGGSWVRNSELFEIVGHKGFYKSGGFESSFLGFGCQFLFIDDLLPGRNEAYSESFRERIWQSYSGTLRTRLEKNGSILIVQTRWHEDDTCGRLLSTSRSDALADPWTVVNFPAIREDVESSDDPRSLGEALWPNKFSLQELEAIRADQGAMAFNAEYLGRPSSASGNLFKREFFQYWQTLPEEFDEVIQSWDMAFRATQSSDYVVGQTWARRKSEFFLLAQDRRRLDFSATLDAVRRMSEKYPNTTAILVEGKANGDAVVNVLKKEIPGIIAVDPEGGKVSRANAVAPLFEARQVYLPDPRLNPWVEGYMDELASFPSGKFDDVVDATSQALNRLRLSPQVDHSFDLSSTIASLYRPSPWL